MAWQVESVKGAEDEQKHMQYPVLEQIGMGAHYAVLGAVLYNMPGGWVHAAIFFFLAQTVSGLFLAVVFGLGHNGNGSYSFIVYSPPPPSLRRLNLEPTHEDSRFYPSVYLFAAVCRRQV